MIYKQKNINIKTKSFKVIPHGDKIRLYLAFDPDRTIRNAEVPSSRNPK